MSAFRNAWRGTCCGGGRVGLAAAAPLYQATSDQTRPFTVSKAGGPISETSLGCLTAMTRSPVPPETGKKQTPSPYATGGGGGTLENRLGALLLTRLLTGGPITALNDLAPAHVAFQQTPTSIVDDFVVTAPTADGTTTIRLAIAARRNPAFITSDKKTNELIATLVAADLAAEADTDPATVERLSVAVSAWNSGAQQVAELADVARSNNDADDFYRDIKTPGKYKTGGRLRHLTTMVEVALKGIDQPGAGTSEHRTFRLLQRLWIWQVQLETGREEDWTRLAADLAPATIDRTLVQGAALRDRLAQVAAELAKVSGRVDAATLATRLVGHLAPTNAEAKAGAGKAGANTTDVAAAHRGLVAQLTAASAARRRVRLQVFDLDEEKLSAYFVAIPTPEFGTATGSAGGGDVVVLTGDFGSGKSETAEAWHRHTIDDLAADADAPLPVWLAARDINRPLGEAIDAVAGADRRGRGARIVIDGIDESDPARAQALLEDARILTATAANTQILLTARPGAVTPSNTEHVEAPLLDEDAALALVELAGAGAHATWQWTADMRASVRRPFFALAAGTSLAKDDAPRSEADLIRTLVENALGSGRERGAVTSNTGTILTALAVNLTHGAGGAGGRAGDGLTFSQRQTLRSSRLVADGPGGTVRFSLPILQHWFAAQALLDGTASPDVVMGDRRSFLRWRWAAAVAALSASDTGTLDTLIGKWVSANPGAAGWILNQAFKGGRSWQRERKQNLEPTESPQRLLTALRTWSDALGDLSRRVLPGPVAAGPVKLGVKVEGTRLLVAVSDEPVDADTVADVPDGVHPIIPAEVLHWSPWFSSTVPADEAWPWLMIRDLIARNTIKVLANDPTLGTPDGVWTQEHLFKVAKSVIGRGGSIRSDDIAVADIRSRADDLLERTGGREGRAQFQLGGPTFTTADLVALLEHLEMTGAEMLSSPLPGPDVDNPQNNWVWSLWSSRQLARFEAEVYSRACEAYDEAVADAFARLGWSLPGTVFAPFGILIQIEDAPHGAVIPSPNLLVVRLPMALLPQLAPREGDVLWAQNGRAVAVLAEHAVQSESMIPIMEAVSAWLAAEGTEALGGYGYSSTAADDMTEKRPASSIAAKWLFDDLKTLGLGDGTFPQLG